MIRPNWSADDRQPLWHMPWHRPSIGNGVRLLPGAFVWGNGVIGDHAIIMPNSVVYADVPPRAIMVGNPAAFADVACDCGEPLECGHWANVVTEMPSGAKHLVPLQADMEITCPKCRQTYRAGDICELVVWNTDEV